MSPGNFQEAVPRSDISGNPSHCSQNKFLQCDMKGSRFQYIDPKYFQFLPGPNSQEDDAKFSEFSKKAEDGPSRAGTLSKTLPEVPITIRVSSGNPESRLSLRDSKYSRVGWERGMLQSCSLSQDRKNILRRSRNSPCSASPESESGAD